MGRSDGGSADHRASLPGLSTGARSAASCCSSAASREADRLGSRATLSRSSLALKPCVGAACKAASRSSADPPADAAAMSAVLLAAALCVR